MSRRPHSHAQTVLVHFLCFLIIILFISVLVLSNESTPTHIYITISIHFHQSFLRLDIYPLINLYILFILKLVLFFVHPVIIHFNYSTLHYANCFAVHWKSRNATRGVLTVKLKLNLWYKQSEVSVLVPCTFCLFLTGSHLLSLINRGAVHNNCLHQGTVNR